MYLYTIWTIYQFISLAKVNFYDELTCKFFNEFENRYLKESLTEEFCVLYWKVFDAFNSTTLNFLNALFNIMKGARAEQNFTLPT